MNSFIQGSLLEVESPFKVDRFTGEIRVREGVILDFETTSTYTMEVKVNGVVETIQINLNDLAGE